MQEVFLRVIHTNLANLLANANRCESCECESQIVNAQTYEDETRIPKTIFMSYPHEPKSL